MSFEIKKIDKFVVKTIEETKLCTEREMMMFDPDNIDLSLLRKLINSEILSYSETKALLCLFQTILQKNKISVENFPKLDSKISKYLINSQKLIVTSIQGMILYIDIAAKGNRIVLKRTRTMDIKSTQREYIIGIKSINPLRSLTPCFAVTLGGFSCSGDDIFIDSGQICTPDNTGPESFYVMMENVKGKTFSDCIADGMNESRFMRNFIAILLSLEIAQRKCCFTHFDLHPGNVMMKPYPTSVEIHMFNDTYNYVAKISDELPVIIDYGYSFSVVDGFPLGEVEKCPVGPIGNYMVPCYDIYRFLTACVYHFALRKNFSLCDLILGMFSIFPVDEYKIFKKYIALKASKNNAIQNYLDLVSKPIDDFCIKVATSSPFITPLKFIKELNKMYPYIMSQFLTIFHRSSLGITAIDTSSKIYCDLFKCTNVDKTDELLKTCITKQPSYILNLYNMYLLIKYRENFFSKEISNILVEQEETIKKKNKEMLKYDEIVFRNGVEYDFVRMFDIDENSLTPIYIVGLKFDEARKKIAIESYRKYSPRVKELYENLVLFGKYLDIYYTIIEMGQKDRAEYAKFINNMAKTISTVSQKNLDIIRQTHRWCLSLEQFYKI